MQTIYVYSGSKIDVTVPFVLSCIACVSGIVIVILGLVGNTLVLLVYGQKSKINSTNIYLLNLAASDLTITLIGQLSRVFPRALTGFDTGSYHPWICKLWFFINHRSDKQIAWEDGSYFNG